MTLRVLMLALALALTLSLSGCGVWNQVFGGGQVTAPVPTATRIPLPTATRPPAPAAATVAPATGGQPKTAPVLPGVTDLTARFTGNTVQGSFKLGGETVQYVYTLQNLGVVGNQLQMTGAITYQRAGGQGGSVPNVTATLATEGESCERVSLDMAPVVVPELNTTIPRQQVSFNLAEVAAGGNPAVSAICQIARTVQSNPNNPLVNFLLDQVNRQLR